MKLLPLVAGLSTVAFAAPRVYYTDIDRGPSIPANGGRGAFITIYGTGFGHTQDASAVTIGGNAPASYTSWSRTQIVVRLGSGNTPGSSLPIVVTVNGVASNNDVTFTIDNTHNIYYFDPSQAGESTDTCTSPTTGTETSPWRYLHEELSARSLTYYIHYCIGNGDIVYVRAGSIDRSDSDGFHAVLTMAFSPAVTWAAIVAYPGEIAIIDGSNAGTMPTKVTLRDKGPPSGTGYVIAGLHIVGSPGTTVPKDTVDGNVINLVKPGRIIGNYVTGPDSCQYDAIGVATLSTTDFPSGISALGNEITNVGTNCNGGKGPSKLMHSMYFECINCEVAWNYIHDNKTYNGIQFHFDGLVGVGGYYNLSIHDNWVQDQHGSGINLSTIDFPTGTEYVKIYNNILYHEGAVAIAYNEAGGGQIKSCIALKDAGRPAARGIVQVYNNTMVDCSALFNDKTFGWTTTSGALYKRGAQPGVMLDIQNNVVYAPPYYWTDPARGSKQLNAYVSVRTSQCCVAQLYGTNNLWYGSGSSPSYLQNNVNSDPMFTSLSGLSLQPLSSSPAVNEGVPVAWIQTDRAGVGRPVPPSLGAYEKWPLSCDLNSDGVVNILDVLLMTNQSLGLTPCTATLDGNPTCDDVDIQRVVAAALGGACLVTSGGQTDTF
jgi:IPT/TIG domain